MIRSGFGKVFKAWDKCRNKTVAIKMAKSCSTNTDLETECEMLRKYQSNFIVRYYDYLTVDDELWVVITHIIHR